MKKKENKEWEEYGENKKEKQRRMVFVIGGKPCTKIVILKSVCALASSILPL